MVNKYFRLAKEKKDLEAKIESKIEDIEDETGQTIGIHFYASSFQISSMHFGTYFSDDGKRETSPLCNSNDMPDTVDAAREKAEEMFKANKDWEELLVKIDEVLVDE